LNVVNAGGWTVAKVQVSGNRVVPVDSRLYEEVDATECVCERSEDESPLINVCSQCSKFGAPPNLSTTRDGRKSAFEVTCESDWKLLPVP
jgi:hypothetical protein